MCAGQFEPGRVRGETAREVERSSESKSTEEVSNGTTADKVREGIGKSLRRLSCSASHSAHRAWNWLLFTWLVNSVGTASVPETCPLPIRETIRRRGYLLREV